jgi:hypothetical protein
MWCGNCQSDVAAEVSPDNQRVFCTICGAVLSTIDLPPTRPVTERLGDRTKDARELLQRWSSGQVVDPFGPLPQPPRPLTESRPISVVPVKETNVTPVKEPIVTTPTPVPIPVVVEAAPSRAPVAVREPVLEPPLPHHPNPLTAKVEPSQQPIAPQLNPLTAAEGATSPGPTIIPSPFFATTPSNNPENQLYRIDAAHPALHFATATPATAPSNEAIGPFVAKPDETEAKREPRRPVLWFPTWDPAVWRSDTGSTGSWSSMTGQFLAYIGVLGMTAGACLVVWSYFGGPADYAPMGWVLATAGQMLLFFGVVTLVSGGLEQTTEQVNKRIEQLGDHIIRIEQTAREISLRGSVPPAHFGDDHEAVASQRSELAQ